MPGMLTTTFSSTSTYFLSLKSKDAHIGIGKETQKTLSYQVCMGKEKDYWISIPFKTQNIQVLFFPSGFRVFDFVGVLLLGTAAHFHSFDAIFGEFEQESHTPQNRLYMGCAKAQPCLSTGSLSDRSFPCLRPCLCKGGDGAQLPAAVYGCDSMLRPDLLLLSQTMLSTMWSLLLVLLWQPLCLGAPLGPFAETQPVLRKTPHPLQPSSLWSPNLRPPYPTNTWWIDAVLGDGSTGITPEPYTVWLQQDGVMVALNRKEVAPNTMYILKVCMVSLVMVVGVEKAVVPVRALFGGAGGWCREVDFLSLQWRRLHVHGVG